MKNNYFPPYFVIKDGIHGLGVFLTTDVKKGKVLFKMKGPVLDHPTQTSVQVGRNQHIENEIAGHVNHSCSPTAKVHRRSRYFVSLRDLKEGEEICFNYNDNEDNMAIPFKCECCGKKIMGKKAKTVTRKRVRKTETETA